MTVADQKEKKEAEAVLFCDGGARGNPGPAAAAFVLREAAGHQLGPVIARDGFYLGVATNNEAEYQAVTRGLEAALGKGIKRIEIRVDSELVARQLNGEYRVKNSRLQQLYARTIDLLNKFDQWEVLHVRRGANRDADALVNTVLDSRKRPKKIDN